MASFKHTKRSKTFTAFKEENITAKLSVVVERFFKLSQLERGIKSAMPRGWVRHDVMEAMLTGIDVTNAI